MSEVKPYVFDSIEIAKILPHRYPFLLVDKIIELDLERGWIVGQKNLTINEQFFQGHFPEVPLMPGVLIIEALAQTGGVLIHERGFKGKIAVLLNTKEARFRKPVKPGDVLYLRVQELLLNAKGGKMKAQAYVNGDQLAAEAEIGFALVNKEQL